MSNTSMIVVGGSAVYGMAFIFKNAVKLRTAHRIDCYGTKTACFANMFQNSGIEEAPLITSPYTGSSFMPEDYIFSETFSGCTEINSISDM